jgi:hypothetical protein
MTGASATGASTEAVLHQSLRAGLAAFGLEASLVWTSRQQGGRTLWQGTLTPPSPSPLPPRRWASVAQALQALAEAALVARGEASAAVEVLSAAASAGESAPGPGDDDEALVQAALRLGRLAAAQGRGFALGPMSANERRLVHQALSELPSVRTQSEGEGIYRRLWVLPRA